MKTVCIIGAFDTKGEDHAFLREQILANNLQVVTVNIGVLGSQQGGSASQLIGLGKISRKR
jgi:uncharacterized protein (UPF0261 family)